MSQAPDPGPPPPCPLARSLDPWPRLLGALGAAGSPRALVLAALGLLLTQAGGWALDAAFGRPDRGPEPMARPGVVRFEGRAPSRDDLRRAAAAIAEPLRVVAAPIGEALAIGRGPARVGRAIAEAAWGLLVWGVVGGAIARLAAEGADPLREGGGMLTALRFTLGRRRSLLAAPLGILLLVGVLALPAALLGVLAAIGSPGADAAAGLLLGVPLLLAVPSALLLIGLALGWPLMVATVAAEGEDAFDAVGRSFSYLSRRPGTFAGAAALLWAAGAVGLILASQFARLAIHLAGWGLAIGGPAARIAPAFSWSGPGATDWPPMMGAWMAAVGLLLHAWAFAYFWSASARLYLLLRAEVDGTPWHDLYAPEEDGEPFAPDPPAPGTGRGDESGAERPGIPRDRPL